MYKVKNETLIILCLFAFSMLMMLKQIEATGYFSIIRNDTFTYTSWSWQFREALKEGSIYPRWMPLNFWGYGSPTFILYPPLVFYLVSLLSILTKSVVLAMNIAKLIALFLTAVGIFFFLREFLLDKFAWLGAVLYMASPYTIFGLYYTGTFASTISLMWFAPILLFIYKYAKGSNVSCLIYAGLCYGGLILTHLLNAYMFAFILIAWAICWSVSQKKLRCLSGAFLSLTIGSLISAAYLLPLICERGYVNLEAFIKEGGGFHYSHFFIFPNLAYKHPVLTWAVYYDKFFLFTFSFCAILLLIVLLASKLRYLRTVERLKTLSLFFIGTALCSILLMFGFSAWLWEAVPFFKFIQFPFRWLNVTNFSIVFLAAILLKAIDSAHFVKMHYFIMFSIALLLCLLVDYKIIASSHMFSEQKLLPVKSVNCTPEHLPTGVDIDKLDKDEIVGMKRVAVFRGKGVPEIESWKSAERIIKVAADQPLILRVRTFNFPGWTAYINNNEAKIKTEGETGAILVDIPAGRHTLVLRFLDTPIRYYSKLISGVAISAMILLLFLNFKKENHACRNGIGLRPVS